MKKTFLQIIFLFVAMVGYAQSDIHFTILKSETKGLSEDVVDALDLKLHQVFNRNSAAAADVYHFILDKMVDTRPGSEWFWQTDKYGTPAHKPIVEPWKCPYHNGRMCMELMKRNPNVNV